MQGFVEPDLVNRMTVDSRHWFDHQVNPDDALVVITASFVPGKNVDMQAPTGSMFLML
jgi:hypothetical protein